MKNQRELRESLRAIGAQAMISNNLGNESEPDAARLLAYMHGAPDKQLHDYFLKKRIEAGLIRWANGEQEHLKLGNRWLMVNRYADDLTLVLNSSEGEIESELADETITRHLSRLLFAFFIVALGCACVIAVKYIGVDGFVTGLLRLLLVLAAIGIVGLLLYFIRQVGIAFRIATIHLALIKSLMNLFRD